jgi:hypothetical protein
MGWSKLFRGDFRTVQDFAIVDGAPAELRSPTVAITVLRQHGSPPCTRRGKDAYESPVSKDGEIGQDANCTCDPAALAERKNADANADGLDGG